MPRDKSYAVSAIKYQVGESANRLKVFVSIGLRLTNGFESPLYASKEYIGTDIQEVELPVEKAIRIIKGKCEKNSNCLQVLSFWSSKREIVAKIKIF